MKKFLSFITAVSMLCACMPVYTADAAIGSVALTEANFPDPVFRQYLIDEKDKDSNGILEGVEFLLMRLDMYAVEGVQSYKGIELLTELYYANLTGSVNVAEIDFSKNTKLESLCLNGVQLTSLDVSCNPELESLQIGDTNIISIDLSHNPKLQTFICDGSSITSVDLSNNPELDYLNISDTEITELDLSALPKLATLWMNDTPVTDLDLTCCPLLMSLEIRDYQGTFLDLSQNTQLSTLDARDTAFTSVDFSNNPELSWVSLMYATGITELDVSCCPNLSYLYVDRMPITELDLSNNTQLQVLSVDQCKELKTLDTSACTALDMLLLSYSGIESIDLTNNTKLTELDASNSMLSRLDLSSNTMLESLRVSGVNLFYLNLDAQTNLDEFASSGYVVEAVFIGNSVDLADYTDDGFDISRVSNVQNATLDGTVLTINDGNQYIKYDYDTGNSVAGKITYTIMVSDIILTEANFEEIEPQRYTGEPIEPEVRMTLGGATKYYMSEYSVEYSNNVEVGTANVTVTIYNDGGVEAGVLSTFTKTFEIIKAIPEYTVPTDITVTEGSKLSEIKLPDGFTWNEPNTILSTAGNTTATVTYTPNDTAHYEIVKNISVPIIVTESAALCGDINLDGSIDVKDASLALAYYANVSSGNDYTFSKDVNDNKTAMAAADVDKNGSINIADCTYILSYYAKSSAGIATGWDEIIK